MRSSISAILVALAAAAAPATAQPAAVAPPAAAPAAGGYSTADTQLGALLDDPRAKAVLERHIPDIVRNDQIEMARGMTLRTLQQYAADMLTDEKLTAIDAELARLPAAG